MYNRVTSAFSYGCHIDFFCLVEGEENGGREGYLSLAKRWSLMK
jgi:hypothetical protein